jgi:hypothetical protein
MTLAELILLAAAVLGVYVLLRPLQRRLEAFLVRRFSSRRGGGSIVDVTRFTSRPADEKENHRNEDRL